MVSLYVTSSQESAGKTTICAGIGKNFQKSGKKVGFLKLVADGKPDSDAGFMKRIFNLQESVEDMCPALDSHNLLEKVKQAHARIASGKDVVIIEGLPLDASSGVVEALGAKVIVVDGYGAVPATASYKKLGAQLAGVVLNKVPKKKVAAAQSEASAMLSQAGVNLLGVLPEDRTLVAMTIGELADLVKGKILDGANISNELIENFMLGAMTIDPGPLYYGRKSEKAVLIRSERPDMQMAALETPTRCLVLVGDAAPVHAVANRAKSKKVAVILAGGDIMGLATTIENAFAGAKFNQDKKLAKLGEIMAQGFNFKAIAG